MTANVAPPRPSDGSRIDAGKRATAKGLAEQLKDFRGWLHGSCLRRRSDALFELSDAVLAAGAVPSPVHLSLQTVHRRGWGSLYAALRHGQVEEAALRDLLARYPLAGSDADGLPAVYAVDQSVWPRCDAEASPGRGYHYHPSRHSAGQPIVAGWAYQLVAQLGFERDSWVAPVDACRVRPEENANDVAAGQVRALVGRLPARSAVALFVFDAGYDPVRLQLKVEACRTQILVRLHSGRAFYAEPDRPAKRPIGRPFRHGAKLDCKEPKTWPEPSAEHVSEDAGYGAVRVRVGRAAPQDSAGGRAVRQRDRGGRQGHRGPGGGREAASGRASA